MSVVWVSNEEKSVLDVSIGIVILVKLKCKYLGISHTDKYGNDYTVDISYMRSQGKVLGSEGDYEISDIEAWAEI